MDARARASASQHPGLYDTAIPWVANGTMRTLCHLKETMRSSDYAHATTIDGVRGEYRFDCSGMVDWVLERSAPVASATLRMNRAKRPLARDFYSTIATAPTVGEYGGWARVPTVFEAQPGDVVAWLPHATQKSTNTGHVAFLVHRPVQLPGYADAYLLRIADSTRDYHAYDTRAEHRSDGFGFGTIVLVVDERDSPIGYGWSGTLSPRVHITNIAIGRALR